VGPLWKKCSPKQGWVFHLLCHYLIFWYIAQSNGRDIGAICWMGVFFYTSSRIYTGWVLYQYYILVIASSMSWAYSSSNSSCSISTSVLFLHVSCLKTSPSNHLIVVLNMFLSLFRRSSIESYCFWKKDQKFASSSLNVVELLSKRNSFFLLVLSGWLTLNDIQQLPQNLSYRL
jgi:hypothetical protein